MPFPRATAERALRRAHEAGDVEAARVIARGIVERGLLDQPQRTTAVNPQPGDVLPLPGTEPAPPAGFDWGRAVGEGLGGAAGATAGFAAGGPVLSVLGGGAGAAAGGEIVEQARRYPALGEPASMTEMLFPFPAAVARGARALIEGPTGEARGIEEVATEGRDAFRQGALGGALGFLARGPLQMGENVLRTFGRGLRTRPAAQIAMQQHRAAQATAGVVDDAGPVGTFFSEMAKMAGLGTGAEVLSGGLTGGGAAIATTVLRLPEATKAVLTNSPSFARWALARGLSTPLGAGAEAVGQTAAQAGEAAGFSARDFDALIEAMAAEGPKVASAVRDFIREMAMQEEQR